MRTEEFLSGHGYTLVNEPEAGDVVGFTEEIDPSRLPPTSTGEPRKMAHFYNHFGVIIDDEIVESRWGKGPVVKHRIDLTPRIYGNTVYFFRKTATADSESEADNSLRSFH